MTPSYRHLPTPYKSPSNGAMGLNLTPFALGQNGAIRLFYEAGKGYRMTWQRSAQSWVGRDGRTSGLRVKLSLGN